MKLLFDENLSHRILPKIVDLYPGSSHVKDHGLIRVDDEVVWAFAIKNDFVIISKDSDFHQRSLVRGIRLNLSIFGSETVPASGSWKFCDWNLRSSKTSLAEQRKRCWF